MGRRLKRMFAREQKVLTDREELLERIRERKKLNALVVDVSDNTENYVKHHITGELYTAMALVLRMPPYRWTREKVMRYLDKVGAIINDLDEKRICDADLVTEGEKWGIRVKWDAKHELIQEMDIFEE